MSTMTENISAAQVKDLREKTGAPMMDCRSALTEAKGDIEQAVIVLRKKGMASAAKKASRAANEGAVGTYIHAGGKIGVLVEINCESDFVARTEDFQELMKDIAMHIAATDPRYVRREDYRPRHPEPRTLGAAKRRSSGRPGRRNSARPAPVVEKIVEGKMSKFYEEVCLLDQPFVSRTRPSPSRT